MRKPDDTRSGLVLAAAAAVIVIASVYVLSLFFIFETGICCGDDASHAVVAKALAEEGRYGWPRSSSRFDLFSPAVGSGPGLILPAALAVKLLGAETWVPGLTALILSTVLMAAMGLTLAGRFSITGVVLFIATLVAVLHGVSGWQWFFPVLLGELPAYALVLIGTAALASGRGAYFAGFAFGAAFLTKQIVLFSEAAIILVWFGLQWREKGWRSSLAQFLRLVTAAAAPALAYELVKLSVLGAAGYRDHLVDFTTVTKRMAVGGPATFSDRLQLFSEAALKTYYAGWNTATAGIVGIGALIGVSRDKDQRTNSNLAFGGMLMAGGLAHLAYVLLISILWSRYLYIGVALLTAAAVSPILSLRTPIKFLYALAIATLLLTPSAVARTIGRALDDSRHAAHLRETVKFVEDHPDLPIVTQDWATFYDVLFLLEEDREWTPFWGIDKVKYRAHMIVLNNHFARPDVPEYQAAISGCRLGLTADVYRVYMCKTD